MDIFRHRWIGKRSYTLIEIEKSTQVLGNMMPHANPDFLNTLQLKGKGYSLLSEVRGFALGSESKQEAF